MQILGINRTDLVLSSHHDHQGQLPPGSVWEKITNQTHKSPTTGASVVEGSFRGWKIYAAKLAVGRSASLPYYKSIDKFGATKGLEIVSSIFCANSVNWPTTTTAATLGTMGSKTKQSPPPGRVWMRMCGSHRVNEIVRLLYGYTGALRSPNPKRIVLVASC